MLLENSIMESYTFVERNVEEKKKLLLANISGEKWATEKNVAPRLI